MKQLVFSPRNNFVIGYCVPGQLFIFQINQRYDQQYAIKAKRTAVDLYNNLKYHYIPSSIE